MENSSHDSKLTPAVVEIISCSSQQTACVVDAIPVSIRELIAGGTAGAFAKTAIAPLERTKILLQTRSEGFHSTGLFHLLKTLLKHEGFFGFYKGNGASVLRIIPYAALHFMTYEQYKAWILCNYSTSFSGPIVDLLAGSLAGGTAVLSTYPLDVARTKLAYQVARDEVKDLCSRPAYGGIKDVIATAYKEGGIRAVYRGLGPTLAGILPYAGLKFYTYEELKRHTPEEYQKSITLRLCCGAVAGLIGQTFTYPLDVVRRQMQIDSSTQKYKNTVDGIRTTIRNQGWRQLFAGLSINYVKVIPSVAIGFTVYDAVKEWLHIPKRPSIQ